MGFFERMKNKWSSMSTNEKAKLIVKFLCDVGGGILANNIGKHYTKDEPGVVRRVVRLTTFSLGSAIGGVAANELNDIVDVIVPKPEEKKAEEEEANA